MVGDGNRNPFWELYNGVPEQQPDEHWEAKALEEWARRKDEEDLRDLERMAGCC